MEKTNSSTTGLGRTKSDQFVETLAAAFKSPVSSDPSAGASDGGGNLSRKSSRRLMMASPGRGSGRNTHIRKARSAQLKMELDEVSSGAALSRASSASLGLSFSFTGFAVPSDEIADSRPFSDDDIRKHSFYFYFLSLFNLTQFSIFPNFSFCGVLRFACEVGIVFSLNSCMWG